MGQPLPTHADGDFCPVVFSLDEHGTLRTYTYRAGHIPWRKGDLIAPIVHCDSRADWHVRFIDTEFKGVPYARTATAR